MRLFQNGKQESFWNGIERRLLPMLEGVADLTLAQLNKAMLAWIEMEYHRSGSLACDIASRFAQHSHNIHSRGVGAHHEPPPKQTR